MLFWPEILIPFDFCYKTIRPRNVVMGELVDYGPHFFIIHAKTIEGVVVSHGVTHRPEEFYHHRNYHGKFYFVEKAQYEDFTENTLISPTKIEFIYKSKLESLYYRSKMYFKNDFPQNLYQNLMFMILENKELISVEFIELIEIQNSNL